MNYPIFIITDFGYDDYYVGAIKAKIISINPDAKIIDITHNVAKWNIIQGGFILWQIIPYLPQKSIILGVIDPGVGSKRRNIIIETNRHYLVGPDNGLLYLPSIREGIKKVYEVKISKKFFEVNYISSTFHGRDIYAPTAAYLSIGIHPSKIGKEILTSEIRKLIYQDPEIQQNSIILTILHIDSFGNLILNISCEKFIRWIQTEDINLELIHKKKKYKVIFVKTFEDLDKDEVGILCGSSNLMEIVMKKKKVNECLDAKVGDQIIIKK